ncbi:hypothetical protein [Candidatus Parabeggiatoa sp. HSG14]|uniref:hypothetical protein n=1 Tax=Candidatus Parabeggiatoa sp. HSG14 TaxID=3055593 RepID=UPI0032E399F4
MNWIEKKICPLSYLGTFLLLILLIPIVIVEGGAYWVNSNIPTHIRLDLVVNQISFRHVDKTIELNKYLLSSLRVKQFTRIDLNPQRLESANPNKSISSTSIEQYPEDAWTKIPLVKLPMKISKGDVNFIFNQAELATLEGLQIHTDDIVTFKTEEAHKETILTIKIERAENRKELPIRLFYPNNPFQFTTTGRTQLNVKIPYQNNSLAFRVSLPEKQLNIYGNTIELKLDMPFNNKEIPIFMEGHFPTINKLEVENFEFIGKNKQRATVLREKGIISYPEYPKINNIQIEESDILSSDPKNIFVIEKMFLNAGHIKSRVQGEVEYPLETHPIKFSDKRKEHRLTKYDTFTEDRTRKIRFNFWVWWFPIFVSGALVFVIFSCQEIRTSRKEEI